MPNVSSFGAQTDNSVVQGTVTDRAMVIPDVPPSGLMSVGPRVTPHFVKPSLWSALTTYHFFDAVHDAAGASYVAIKPEVPAGTELTDEGYWFLWADPNSQFADLSELVKTFNGRVEQNAANIKTETERATAKENELAKSITDNKVETDTKIESLKSHVLLIGNSYTIGFDSVSEKNSLRYNLTDLFNVVDSYGEAAAGFVRHKADGADKTFSEMLTQWANVNADKTDKITHVIFNVAVGDSYAFAKLGQNEYNTQLQAQIRECVNKVKTLYPNAKRIGVMYMDSLYKTARLFSDTDGSSYYVNLEDMCEVYELLKFNAPNIGNVEFYGWCGWNLIKSSYMNNADDTHPSATSGYKAMVQQWKGTYLGNFDWRTFSQALTIPLNDKSYTISQYFCNPTFTVLSCNYSKANGANTSDDMTTTFEKKDLPFINMIGTLRFEDLFKIQFVYNQKQLIVTSFGPITNLSSRYEFNYKHIVDALGSPE